MFDRILLPTDGGDVARNAADSAVRLAARFDATVHVLHVLELGELPPGVEDADADEFAHVGETAIDEITSAAGDAGVETDTDVVESHGPTHEVIVEFATEHGADLVVMGTHGRSGLDRIVLGSVTERTLRESDVPVLTVHEGGGLPADRDLENVLVPIDGSQSADAALALGIDLAAETGATLHLITLIDTSKPWHRAASGETLGDIDELGKDVLDNALLRAEAADVSTIEGSVGRGKPETAILEYAADHDADCIVMGTHGRSGLNRYLLGSVTEHVVRTADAPVLSVRAVENQ